MIQIGVCLLITACVSGGSSVRSRRHELSLSRHLPTELSADTPTTFALMVHADSVEEQERAWRLASDKPSPAMEHEVRLFLRDVLLGRARTRFPAAMAEAILNNHIHDVYPLLRQGLFQSGEQAYVQAMIDADPALASNDFLSYLAKQNPTVAPLPPTCLRTWSAILKHMLTHHPDAHHPSRKILEAYAQSSAAEIAGPARRILAKSVIEAPSLNADLDLAPTH